MRVKVPDFSCNDGKDPGRPALLIPQRLKRLYPRLRSS